MCLTSYWLREHLNSLAFGYLCSKQLPNTKWCIFFNYYLDPALIACFVFVVNFLPTLSKSVGDFENYSHSIFLFLPKSSWDIYSLICPFLSPFPKSYRKELPALSFAFMVLPVAAVDSVQHEWRWLVPIIMGKAIMKSDIILGRILSKIS